MPFSETNWDETAPAASDAISNGDDYIRELKGSVRLRLSKEHVLFAGSSVGGEHKMGSAVIYVVANEAALPTNKPDGTTALDDDDDGRLALALDTKLLYWYDATTDAWVKINANATFTQVPEEYIVVQQTTYGTFTAGAWRNRVLDTIPTTTDPNDRVTLDVAGEKFNLAAGTYRCRAWAKGYCVDKHMLQLAYADGSVVLGIGTANADSGNSVENKAEFSCRFTLASAQDLRLRHWCQTTKASYGMGSGPPAGLEAYESISAQIELWKEVT